MLWSIPIWLPLVAYSINGFVVDDVIYPIDWCAAKVCLNVSIMTFLLIAIERWVRRTKRGPSSKVLIPKIRLMGQYVREAVFTFFISARIQKGKVTKSL